MNTTFLAPDKLLNQIIDEINVKKKPKPLKIN